MEFYQRLEILLKKNEKYLDADRNIIKQKVKDAAEKIDPELIELLISEPEIKKEFFSQIKDVWIFNINHFVTFIDNKNFLNDSYTAFSNRIGLSVNGELLKKRDEVCLVFPYKDCILEGGQTKEESKRNEIFFNKILAKDEINKLLSPKALVNFEKWDEEAVKRGSPKTVNDITEEDNLLIKGNNLLALHCLKRKYAGKVKLIYIDPPYNTGNDSFKYNDNFKHSSWLTFMKNRLEIARELLRDDGSIYVNVDYNEAHYLKILMDDVFGRNNFQREIIWRIGWVSGHKTKAQNFIRNHDTILFFSKNPNDMYFNKDCAYIDNENFPDKTPNDLKKYLQNLGITRYDISKILAYINHESRPNRYPIEDVWNANEYDELNSIAIMSFAKESVSSFAGKERSVKGQKSEALLKRIMEISTEENDLVLDFFSGTATTAVVAQKMHRKWICIEQIDNQIDVAKQRLQKVIEGEQSGISKALNWSGGGSFIYFELATYNQRFVEEIEQAQNSTTLLAIWDEMKNYGFLLHNVRVKEFDKNINEFKKLELEKQKEVLIETLNMNMLYVPLSDIEDMKYHISDDDIELNKVFYGNEYTSKEGEL